MLISINTKLLDLKLTLVINLLVISGVGAQQNETRKRCYDMQRSFSGSKTIIPFDK